MQFFMLSVPEASLLFLGIAIQAVVSATLAGLAAPIIAVNLLILLVRTQGQGLRAILAPLGYVVSSLIIMALFMPASFGFGAGPEVPASSVRSFAATQSGAPVQTAADSNMVPVGAAGLGRLPLFYATMMEAIGDFSVELAQEISASRAERPFSAVQPMKWLLQAQLSNSLVTATRDFASGCYGEALAKLRQEGAGSLSYQDMLPWGGALDSVLSRIQKVPGVTVGAFGEVQTEFSSGPNPVSCSRYAAALSSRATTYLESRTTQGGTPLPQIWQDELGIAPIEAGRFLVFREIAAAVGGAIPAPSLTGTYLNLKAAALGASVLSRLTGGGRVPTGTDIAGAATGEIGRVFDGLAQLIQPALYIIKVAPYAMGILALILVGLSPVVFLGSLAPGNQFRLILGFFALLAVVMATPLWWALVDLGATAAAGFEQHSILLNPLASSAAYVVYTAIIVVAVPLVIIGLFLVTSFVGVRQVRRLF